MVLYIFLLENQGKNMEIQNNFIKIRGNKRNEGVLNRFSMCKIYNDGSEDGRKILAQETQA